jgi:hypothetical protein
VAVATDVTSGSSSALNAARSNHAAVSEGVKVIHAGDSAAPRNSSERMVFATEVVTGLAATLTAAKGGCLGSMSPTNGYAVGGSTTAGAAPTTGMQTAVDKIALAAETISAVGGAALSTATRSLAPVSIQQ